MLENAPNKFKESWSLKYIFIKIVNEDVEIGAIGGQESVVVEWFHFMLFRGNKIKIVQYTKYNKYIIFNMFF